MAEIELIRMTWREAEEARDRGAVVLMPIGTLEQNGSVCPLGVDTLVAEEVARRVASETGAIVTPALNFGYSPQFRRFPGTISLSPDTLRKLVLDASVNLVENGFTHILFVNCHISSEPIIEHAARELRDQYGILTGWINPIYLAQAASKDLYSGKENTLGHGSEPIASMLRSFDPDAVKLDAAEQDQWKEYQGLTVAGSSKVKVGGAVFGLFFGTDEAAETGGTGDPTASDPERGAEIMRRVVAQTAEFVRTFAELEVIDED